MLLWLREAGLLLPASLLGGSTCVGEGAQLRRAASGTRVCPFILTAGTWGNSTGKFHFYSSGTWRLHLYFYFILFF